MPATPGHRGRGDRSPDKVGSPVFQCTRRSRDQVSIGALVGGKDLLPLRSFSYHHPSCTEHPFTRSTSYSKKYRIRGMGDTDNNVILSVNSIPGVRRGLTISKKEALAVDHPWRSPAIGPAVNQNLRCPVFQDACDCRRCANKTPPVLVSPEECFRFLKQCDCFADLAEISDRFFVEFSRKRPI